MMRSEGLLRATSNVREVSPFTCRLWPGHQRLAELITEETCKEEIESVLQHGQKQPVLGRPLRGDPQYEVELIYGARRHFVARHLNVPLLVDVREMSDREAFIEMDIENRLRCEVSPYERGMAYKEWLRQGYFESQKDIAEALGISTAQVSRLLRFAELPAVIVSSFGDQTRIRESWAVALAERCKDPCVKSKMVSVARLIAREDESVREPANTLKRLLDCEERTRNSRVACRDTIVRSDDGDTLFRISYRNNDVHIVLPRAVAPAETIEKLSGVLKSLISNDRSIRPSDPMNNKSKYPQLQRLGSVHAEKANGPLDGDLEPGKRASRLERSMWIPVARAGAERAP